jgi:hypothetical protein
MDAEFYPEVEHSAIEEDGKDSCDETEEQVTYNGARYEIWPR